VAELTGLLREGADGDRLDGWPTGMRILARREEIEEGRQLSLFEQTNGTQTVLGLHGARLWCWFACWARRGCWSGRVGWFGWWPVECDA